MMTTWQSAANLMEFVALSLTLACFYVTRGDGGVVETTRQTGKISLAFRVHNATTNNNNTASNLENTEYALAFAAVSVQCLLAGMFIPLALTVYDAVIVPIVRKVWHTEGSASEVVCALLSAAVFTPFTIMASMCGMNFCLGLDVAGELEGSIQNLGVSLVEQRECVGGETDAMAEENDKSR